MVSWWITKEAVQAKVTTGEDGSYVMWMEGEKYPFPGFPRGHLLYGSLSKLKHEIKNQIFNENWWRLEKNEPITIEKACENIAELAKKHHYDFFPYEKLSPAVKEMHKALTHPLWREIICFILNEDDAYRWRALFFLTFVNPRAPYKRLRTWWNGWTDDEALLIYTAEAFDLIEHCEVVGDMKERIRLIKRIMLELFKKEEYLSYYRAFINNLNMKKIHPTKADLYFFRAKYWRVDKYKIFFGKVIEAYDY